MTSKISLFSIMKEDIRNRLWMVALSFLGSFLALPILLLMVLSRAMQYSESTNRTFLLSQSTLYFFKSNILLSCGFVAIFGALIVGLLGFSFLYSKNKVDFFHSIPVKRSKFFLAYYLDGIIIWLFPFLINLLAAIIIGLFNLNDMTLLTVLLANTANSAISIMFSFLIVYHLCLVCVMISGNFFNALISTVILGFSVIGIYGLIAAFCSVYFEHFVELPTALFWDRIIWASPLASVFLILDSGKKYSFFMNNASFILMIVNLVLAWRLYLNRPSELAEQGIQNKKIQFFLRFIGTFALALCGSLLDNLINFRYGNMTNHNLAWPIFGIILMSILFWGIFNIIFNMNFKAFFKNKIQLGITTGLALLTFLSISGDWYGFDLRIPHKDDIKGGTFYMSNYSDDVFDRNLYKGTIDFSEIQYTDVDSIYSLLTNIVDRKQSNDYSYIVVMLNLKNGSNFCRKYKVYSEDKELLKPIIEDESYKKANYPLVTGQLPIPEYISFGDSRGKSDYGIEDNSIIKKLLNAYREDFEEHYNIDELENMPVVGTLYRRYNEYGSYPLEPVYSNYTRTIELLQELQPNMVFTIDDINIRSIEFSISLYDNLPKEALYSYFGLEGYPTLEEITAHINISYSDEAATEYADTVPVDTESGIYNKIITDEESIQELLPYLNVGDYYPYSIFNDDYVDVGYIESNSTTYSCFVEKGKMPQKWIDILMEQ